MANAEQLAILKQGAEVWNEWRAKYFDPRIRVGIRDAHLQEALLGRVSILELDLSEADLRLADLRGAHLGDATLRQANLSNVHLDRADLIRADLTEVDLSGADLRDARLSQAKLSRAILMEADLNYANLRYANLTEANLSEAELTGANLDGAKLIACNFVKARLGYTIFGNSDLSETKGLENVKHGGPSRISTDVFTSSKGKIPEGFLRGCGLSDWEIEEVKLYNPDLSNDEINKILYRMYDLRATQALQISPLFISYSHADSAFADKLERQLNEKGIRFWRDIHEMKAGRMETQIDIAISQNPTVLLILSEHSIKSDWVQHEVRTARDLEKGMGRDILCPVALDDSWKSSPWPKRIMEQIMEYNILDFSEWRDDSKFDGMFRKLIDGLELFYKG